MADRQTDVVGALVSRLGANGWSLTAGHQSLDWANLVLQIPAGELEIEHMSDWWLIRLLLRSGTQVCSVEVEAGDRAGRFLDLLVAKQATLSPESWESFVDQLVEGACVPGSYSAYILEIGSPPYEMFICGGAEPMAMVVAEEFEHLEKAQEDPDLRLWIVHRGSVVRGIELGPVILADDGEGHTFDGAKLRAAAGWELPSPVLTGSRLLRLRLGEEGLDVDGGSNLTEERWWHRGFTDPQRRVDLDEIRREEGDGPYAASLAGLPVGLDDLDVDVSPAELRARGWEL